MGVESIPFTLVVAFINGWNTWISNPYRTERERLRNLGTWILGRLVRRNFGKGLHERAKVAGGLRKS